MLKKPYSVLYISGYGHSGTTILDMILGSTPGAFSLGEMTHMTRIGLMEEYCSCNNKIVKCEFWSKVLRLWNERIGVDMSEYRLLRNSFDTNKNYFNAFFGSIFLTRNFKRYLQLTEALYDVIHEVSGASILVDSSKSASRPFVLYKFTKVRVLHVKRNFSGVANSEKKDVKVEISKGLEAASPPKSWFKVFIDWFVSNLFCSLTSLRLGGKSLRFREWIASPRILEEHADFSAVDLEEGLFKPEHMIAGNAVRLKPPQRIEPRNRHVYHRLNRTQQFVARVIDRILFFYS